MSGEVVEAGAGVEKVKPGDRITASPYVPCGGCPFCRAGRSVSCLEREVIGLTANGAFAEYVRMPARANLFKIPENLSFESAALCEPLSVALNAVEVARIKPGQSAAVLGPGPIGLLTTQLLRASGASPVVAVGLGADADRLQIAQRLGADAVIDLEREDPIRRVLELTSSEGLSGLDLVFEATGSPDSIGPALEMVGVEGKIILMGIHSGVATFDPTALVRGKKSIIGAYASEPQSWRRAIALLASGRVGVDEVITHQMPLGAAQEGIELALARRAGKVVFLP